VFVPRAKLRDNWDWCTAGSLRAGDVPYDTICDDPEVPFIPFSNFNDGRVIVSW
jgi:hypothetical protein